MKKYDLHVGDSDIFVPELVRPGGSLADWEKDKQEIRQRLLQVLGGLPEPVATSYEVSGETTCSGYTRIHLSYSTAYGDKVPAYLLMPLSPVPEGGFPCIMALHGTTPVGKDAVAGIEGIPDYLYGHELALRGYAVLIPDVFTAGERTPDAGPYETGFFYEKHPDWSATGKMLCDHINGVDVLSSWPGVDSSRIGAIGLSLGGFNAYWLAAFDGRIKAAVSDCGLCSLIGNRMVLEWSRLKWFVYFKSIRKQLEAGVSPFEFHEALSLIAPRAFYNRSTRGDETFPQWTGVKAMMDRLHDVYRLYGMEDNLKDIMDEGSHGFPPQARLLAYDFLDKHLSR